MEINNIYGNAAPKTILGVMQSELLKAVAEKVKQAGIIKAISEKLAENKNDAIETMYPNVKVFHEKYGECVCKFRTYYGYDCNIVLELRYFVKEIPTEGLSKHDKAVANRYNNAYGYDGRNEARCEFKTFKEKVCGYVSWNFDINAITSDNFLKDGIKCDKDKSPFTIILK